MTAERGTLARALTAEFDMCERQAGAGSVPAPAALARTAARWLATELDSPEMVEAVARAMREAAYGPPHPTVPAKQAAAALAAIRDRLAPTHRPEAGTGEGRSG